MRQVRSRKFEGFGRLDLVLDQIAATLGGNRVEAPGTLARWAAASGLPGLQAQGVDPALFPRIAAAALTSSSMQGNPVPLTEGELLDALNAAA